MTDDLREKIGFLDAEVQELKDGQDSIISKLDAIQSELTRYKGFIGGVMFIGGGVVAAMAMFKEYLINHLLK